MRTPPSIDSIYLCPTSSSQRYNNSSTVADNRTIGCACDVTRRKVRSDVYKSEAGVARPINLTSSDAPLEEMHRGHFFKTTPEENGAVRLKLTKAVERI